MRCAARCGLPARRCAAAISGALLRQKREQNALRDKKLGDCQRALLAAWCTASCLEYCQLPRALPRAPLGAVKCVSWKRRGVRGQVAQAVSTTLLKLRRKIVDLMQSFGKSWFSLRDCLPKYAASPPHSGEVNWYVLSEPSAESLSRLKYPAVTLQGVGGNSCGVWLSSADNFPPSSSCIRFFFSSSSCRCRKRLLNLIFFPCLFLMSLWSRWQKRQFDRMQTLERWKRHGVHVPACPII